MDHEANGILSHPPNVVFSLTRAAVLLSGFHIPAAASPFCNISNPGPPKLTFLKPPTARLRVGVKVHWLRPAGGFLLLAAVTHALSRMELMDKEVLTPPGLALCLLVLHESSNG